MDNEPKFVRRKCQVLYISYETNFHAMLYEYRFFQFDSPYALRNPEELIKPFTSNCYG